VRHGVALFGSPPREPWGRFVQLVPSGGYRDVRHLAGDEVVLGREEGDIVFRDDAFMSRRHAAVTWDGKRSQITDLVQLQRHVVRVTGPTALKHGDHVRLGDQLLRIELAGDVSEPAVPRPALDVVVVAASDVGQLREPQRGSLPRRNLDTQLPVDGRPSRGPR